MNLATPKFKVFVFFKSEYSNRNIRVNINLNKMKEIHICNIIKIDSFNPVDEKKIIRSKEKRRFICRKLAPGRSKGKWRRLLLRVNSQRDKSNSGRKSNDGNVKNRYLHT